MAIKLNDENFKKEVLQADLPVLVDFWADWCGPCKKIGPTIEELAKAYEDKLKVCKLNVEEAPLTSSEYGIMSIPTLIIFKDGKKKAQIVGAVSKAEIVSKIEPNL